jgi:hypothetical protein
VRLLAVWGLRRLLAAVAVGAGAGLAAYLLGPWLSTVAGAALGCAGSLVARAQQRLSCLWAGLAPSGT